jgi:MOSC domain-containing protein YiiM
MEIVKQSHDTKGVVVLPRRWVGRHVARRLNIDGDRLRDLARHGGEHRAAFIPDRLTPAPASPARLKRFSATGNFGENFTVDGLHDGEVCIGDRYRL